MSMAKGTWNVKTEANGLHFGEGVGVKRVDLNINIDQREVMKELEVFCARESYGKIERFFKTAKEECIRRSSFLSIEDARRIIDRYIECYNYEQLHNAIDYVTLHDMLTGRKEKILEERKKKLENARRIRKENHKSKSNLFGTPVLSDSR